MQQFSDARSNLSETTTGSCCQIQIIDSDDRRSKFIIQKPGTLTKMIGRSEVILYKND